MNNQNTYKNYEQIRNYENVHILLWLIKDLCWCLIWKKLGIIMIVPTILVAFIITYKTRKIKIEFIHNIAVTCWIIANSAWMITEFLAIDEIPLVYNFTYKYLAIIPFVIGIFILLIHYIKMLIIYVRNK